jgi:excisionase family DNA binding protein
MSMNKQVQQLYAKYLELTQGDKAAAASLALADVMFDDRKLPVPESLTVAEAAKRLHVSSKMVYELCARGEIVHHRVGHAIRLRSVDIDEYQRRSTKESRPQVGRFRCLRL